jgi:hypothetical protein
MTERLHFGSAGREDIQAVVDFADVIGQQFGHPGPIPMLMAAICVAHCQNAIPSFEDLPYEERAQLILALSTKITEGVISILAPKRKALGLSSDTLPVDLGPTSGTLH